MIRKIILKFIAPCISAIFILYMLRVVDVNLLSPISIFKISKLSVYPDFVTISGSMYKPEYRDSCALQSVVAVVNSKDPELLFKSSDATTYTRPWGWSTFSGWKVHGTGVDTIELTSRHNCYGSLLWEHSTKLVSIDISSQVYQDLLKK